MTYILNIVRMAFFKFSLIFLEFILCLLIYNLVIKDCHFCDSTSPQESLDAVKVPTWTIPPKNLSDSNQIHARSSKGVAVSETRGNFTYSCCIFIAVPYRNLTSCLTSACTSSICFRICFSVSLILVGYV